MTTTQYDQYQASIECSLVFPICQCGRKTIGQIEKLKQDGWGFDVDGNDLCPSWPDCLPKQEEVEVTF